MSEKQEINVYAADGNLIGKYQVINEDPFFFLPLSSGQNPADIPIYSGGTIELSTSKFQKRRSIIGVTVEASLIYCVLRLIAPRQITKPNPDEPFLVQDGIQLRPGTTIIGGRDSGFYDDYGFIVGAKHVGGDPNKDEDWVYYVVANSDFNDLAAQWILIRNVGFPKTGPSSVVDIPDVQNDTMSSLIDVGEKELISYFVEHPNALDSITPRQFEQLMAAIYKNLGFVTEPIGAWNQADGGVDIIAISKTDAAIEYRLAIQCKASKNKISASPIRELAGVLDSFRSHQGVVATTSRFTAAAKKEVEGSLWKVTLQDRDAIYRRMLAIMRPDIKNFVDRLK